MSSQPAIFRALKTCVNGVCLLLTLPLALLSGFGRLSTLYQTFAHLLALVPGLPGDYLRIAYYYWTLEKCSLYSRVSFGSFFAQSASTVGAGVYVGAYCVLGACKIGDRAQIASHVQLLSGKHQHTRDESGILSGADERTFQPVSIGQDSWIGAAAIVLADVGSRTTVGAGAVVTKPAPDNVVVVGNPARCLGDAR
jgi:virginiamycin A acetyltransferase